MMLIADALIEGDGDDTDYLLTGARLYGVYAGAFAGHDPERAGRLAARSFDYAYRALCEELASLCAVVERPYDLYVPELHKIDDKGDLEVLYAFASAWAGLLRAHSHDWNMVAQLPKVKATVQHILKLDPEYDAGTAQMYAGVLESLLPPSLGGRPDLARQHFEQAISISQGNNLLAKVMYARQARSLLNRPLHDRLLNEVMSADPRVDGLTLINTLAQRQASVLLAESVDYFE